MFEPFSRSYYLGRLYVEPRDDEGAAMCRRQHRAVRKQLYGDDSERPEDRPLVMKLGSRHFPVTGVESVPADTLSVPPAYLNDASVENPPSLTEVLLATEDRADQLLSIAGVPDDAAGV